MAGAFVNLNSMTKYLYSSDLVQNAVFHLFPSLIYIWLKASDILNFINHCAP